MNRREHLRFVRKIMTIKIKRNEGKDIPLQWYGKTFDKCYDTSTKELKQLYNIIS